MWWSQINREWHLTLPYLLFTYKELPKETTGLSPFQLIYGRMLIGPLGVLRDHWSAETLVVISDPSVATAKYIDQLQESLSRGLALAKEHSLSAQESHVKQYNKC